MKNINELDLFELVKLREFLSFQRKDPHPIKEAKSREWALNQLDIKIKEYLLFYQNSLNQLTSK